MQRNAAKYPVERCRGSSAKYTQLAGQMEQQQGEVQQQQQEEEAGAGGGGGVGDGGDGC